MEVFKDGAYVVRDVLLLTLSDAQALKQVRHTPTDLRGLVI